MTTRFIEPFGLGISPRALIAEVRRHLDGISLWWRYHQTVRDLSRLDSHTLKDLGIQRSEVAWIARDAIRNKHRRRNKKLRGA